MAPVGPMRFPFKEIFVSTAFLRSIAAMAVQPASPITPIEMSFIGNINAILTGTETLIPNKRGHCRTARQFRGNSLPLDVAHGLGRQIQLDPGVQQPNTFLVGVNESGNGGASGVWSAAIVPERQLHQCRIALGQCVEPRRGVLVFNVKVAPKGQLC
jgi:hypothetical protein